MTIAGPCINCGITNYPLSIGGPKICPSCDVGSPSISFLKKLIQEVNSKNEELQSELNDLKTSFENSKMYHAVRYKRLSEWAREDLPEDLKHQFFNIYANATKDLKEQPTYDQQYNALKYRCEKLEEEINDLKHASKKQLNK